MPRLPFPPLHFSTHLVTTQQFHLSPCSLVSCIVNLRPLVPGHVLVIPALPYSRLSSLPPSLVSVLFQTVQHVSKTLEKVYAAEAMTICVQDGKAAGQTVDHLHVHVIPRRKGDFQGDEVYDTLEGRRAIERTRCERSLDEMEKEAKWLAGFFV
ncbi:Dinucleoside triphosphate hydrolase [Thecaphora frezii]